MSLSQFKTNTFSVVGHLKEKNLKLGTDRNGEQYLSGNVVIESVCALAGSDTKRNNNIRIDVFQRPYTKSGRDNKLYAGALDVMNNFNIGDKMFAGGDISYNSFTGRDGKLRESNRLRGLFFYHRDENTPDRAQGEIDVVYLGQKPARNKDEVRLSVFTVGYNGRISKVLNLEASKDDFSDVRRDTKVGLIFSIENYTNTVSEDNDLFSRIGKVRENKQKVVTNKFVNRLYAYKPEIIKGDQPTHDEILDAVKELRQEKTISENAVAQSLPTSMSAPEQKNQQPQSQVKQPTDPFATEDKPISISEDDIPF